jgi:HSP20 family molecular chaperone IbpA
MALAPFMPRMDSGLLQDDFFSGLSPFLGGAGAMLPSMGASAGLRQLYVDVSEEPKQYTLQADVPGA